MCKVHNVKTARFATTGQPVILACSGMLLCTPFCACLLPAGAHEDAGQEAVWQHQEHEERHEERQM
jgi:hypothetical protein